MIHTPTSRLSLNMTGHETQYGAHAATVIAFTILSMRTVFAPSPARMPPPTFSAIRFGMSAILTVVVHQECADRACYHVPGRAEQPWPRDVDVGHVRADHRRPHEANRRQLRD